MRETIAVLIGGLFQGLASSLVPPAHLLVFSTLSALRTLSHGKDKSSILALNKEQGGMYVQSHISITMSQ